MWPLTLHLRLLKQQSPFSLSSTSSPTPSTSEAPSRRGRGGLQRAGRRARRARRAPTPVAPRPAGPAAARQRRLFGPRTLARTRSSRPRHVPGGGSGGSPAQGAVAGVAPLSPPPPPSAASLAPSASCAVAPRDSWRDRGGRGGPAPGPLTACHRQPGGASGWT